jgi:hypothetical protein
MTVSGQRHGYLGGFLAAAIVVLCAGVTVVGAPQGNKDRKDQNQKQNDAAAQAQAQEVQAMVRLADAAMTGQQSPSDFPIQFQNDFLRAQQGRVWIPITLTVDASKLSNPAGEPVGVYLRIAPRGLTTPMAPPPPPNDKDKKKKNDKNGAAAPPPPATGYPYEDVSYLDAKPSGPGQPVRIMRGIGIPSGGYDLYVVVKERSAAGSAAPKAAVLKQPLDVPNYASGELSTSTPILAERVDQLQAPITPEQQSERPYTFGQTEIVVNPDHKFKKSQELIILVQIYNPTVSAEKKFAVEATYTFYKQGPDGEKRFNATEPQNFTPENMVAGFDPSSPDRSIQAGQGIPLTSFPEGPYRLEIKVTDKISSKALTQNVTFTVTP